LIPAIGMSLTVGGCFCGWKKDSIEVQARQIPELRELLDRQERHAGRFGVSPDFDDPNFVEKLRKQSRKSQKNTLKQWNDAKKRHQATIRDLENEKAEEAQAASKSQDKSAKPNFLFR
jgi:hypothetical protein